MGSRARSTAATCLVVSGLLLGGGTAQADPAESSGDDSVAATAPAGSRPDRSARPPDAERPSGIDRAASGNSEDVAADRDPEPARRTPRKPDAGERPLERPDSPLPGPCCDEPAWECPPSVSSQDRDRPVGMPPTIPAPALGPQRSDVLDVVPGISVGSADAEELPINAPIVIAGPAGFGPAAVAPGGAGPASAALPPASAAAPASPAAPAAPGRSMPASAGDRVTIPASASRAGYGEYLRGAGVSQIAALALPGLAGILLLTGAGGLLGYRQAKAAQGVRTTGIARFMN